MRERCNELEALALTMADPAQEIARYKTLLVKAKGAIDVQRQQVTEKQREY